MIELNIPGWGDLRLEHLVMDVNGTIAEDGKLVVGVIPRIYRLGQQINLHLLTADTHKTQARIDTYLNMKAHIITGGGAEKAAYVENLGAECVVAIGNGFNDVQMCQVAKVSVAVLGPEGLATALIPATHLLVQNAADALDLLLYPERLRASLRH